MQLPCGRKWRFPVLAVLLVLALARCEGGQESGPPTRISGVLEAAGGGPVAGMIVVEEGRLYSKHYRFGGRVDPQGRFSVAVPGGGDYALHFYATDHIYHPVAVEVEGGRDNGFSFAVPPNPAVREAPVISQVEFEERSGGEVLIRLTVGDPNGNLSHQVLGVNSATGEGFLFAPPKFVLPWTRDYPDGVYTLTYETKGRPFGREEWLFVAADNRCYNSPVLGQPFTMAGIVPARPAGAAAPVEGATGNLSPVAPGEQVFERNCTPCHHADRTGWKVGPGLKGLFARKSTPARNRPVSEDTIREQIVRGGEQMPPYSHLEGERLAALLEYLKTL